ncbi:LCP family protein [Streptomyces cinereospinus]|uniref:LCP family protein n=1 Tax=Streptomyces cinereospinus TaxID=285561 RepID=A0ABV5N8L9_9ACTN
MPSGRPDDETPAVALGPGSGSSATGDGLIRRRRRRWTRGGTAGTAGLLAGVMAAGWAVYTKLDGNITPDEAAAAELARYERERPTALVRGAQNILLIGSDTRAGEDNRKYGRDVGTERSDTTILLHLSAGRRSATAVSIPRDLMVDVPGCRRPDGSRTEPVFAMFNYAFETGGSACTIRTVERMTDIRIDHHAVVDFHGFTRLVDAVGGVRICVAEPIVDKQAKLRLPAGQVTLDGEQALGYVRARKSLGNGSDTGRMERQQRFLAALVRKLRGNDILLNPAKLYPVLDAATSSLTTDPGLASLRGLYDLVRGLRDVPTERVQFLTVPRESYDGNANRDQLTEPAAERLFERLRSDTPVQVSGKSVLDFAESTYESRGNARGRPPGHGEYADSVLAPASPAPTFSGKTAAEGGCR